jgi:hypothetical protein
MNKLLMHPASQAGAVPAVPAAVRLAAYGAFTDGLGANPAEA